MTGSFPTPGPVGKTDGSPAAALPSWPERIPHHPLAQLFPMLAESEINELAEDIRQRGQEQPVWILDGRVLDGRNRAEACHRLEIAPWTEEYKGSDPLGFVLSLNLRRRHLTESQRAMVAAKIIDWEMGMNQTTASRANVSTRQAAQRMSISERAASAAKRVRDHGVSGLVQAIESGRVSVHSGEAISRLGRVAQEEILRREEREIIARAKEIRNRRRLADGGSKIKERAPDEFPLLDGGDLRRLQWGDLVSKAAMLEREARFLRRVHGHVANAASDSRVGDLINDRTLCILRDSEDRP